MFPVRTKLIGKIIVSLENETVADEAEIEQDLEQQSEEVVSEQPKSEDNQDVANPDDETEQVGETEDEIDLGQVLSAKTEAEEKESKVPRSTRRLLRKNGRLEKELEAAKQQLEQFKNSQAPEVKANIPVRDWDKETDEQYNFRMMQAAMDHRQQVNSSAQQKAQQVQRANEDFIQKQKNIDAYAEAVNKLNLPNYDDAESRVLDAMPDGSLSYITSMNKDDPSMTAKVLFHLDHNPEKLAKFSKLAHEDANGFNREFGKLESLINNLENNAKRKRKQVSRATGDRALEHSGSTGNSLAIKMQAAADKGDYATYRKLKAQR